MSVAVKVVRATTIPYLASDSEYSLILLISSPHGLLLYSSSLNRARAWPTKSQVFSSKPNFLYTSSVVVLVGSTSFQVLGSSSLKSWTKRRKFLNLLFSKSPIRSEERASFSSAGTLDILPDFP